MSDGGLAHAIAALRAGRPVGIGGRTVLALETGTAAMLDLLDPDAAADLLMSGERAAALGLANRIEAAVVSAPVRIARADWLDREAALALADPAQDGARGPVGPLTPVDVNDPEIASAAIKLARMAGVLPALWLLDQGEAAASIDPSELDRPAEATIVSRARLPLSELPETQIVVMREAATGEEHVALVIGAFGGRAPLVRLHSECLTGDVFGSLKCDCGPQLQEALRLLAADSGGILLYLRQEGRGIGLANKIRAYQLQDRGFDTVDANRRLGFADDERDYGVAAAMLRALGVSEVRLLTNNPAKLDGLAAAGIAVAERVAHHMPVNPHNADYVATKQRRSGHLD